MFRGRKNSARRSVPPLLPAALRGCLVTAALASVFLLPPSIPLPATAATVDPRLLQVLAEGDESPLRVILLLEPERDSAKRAPSLAPPSAGQDPADRSNLVLALERSAARGEREIAPLLEELSREGKLRRLHRHWIVPALSAEVFPSAIEDLAGSPGVRAVLLDRPQLVISPPENESRRELSTPLPLALQVTWGVERIRAPEVWSELGITGEGVLVALLDTGVDYTHPDLSSRMWRNTGEIPANGSDDDANGYVDDWRGYDFSLRVPDPMDDQGHGTHTAGTVVGDGTGGTSTGVAPGATLMPLKVLSSGYGYESDSWEAIEYAVAHGAHIISMSMGWIQCFHLPTREVWREVAENAAAAGVLIVAAAGNEGDDFGMPWYCPPPANIRTPADVPGVVAVSATEADDQVALFSSIGPATWQDVAGYEDYLYPPGLAKPDLCAPGAGVNSTTLGGGYSGPTWDGTSMACPHVSGTAALMLAANPALSPAEIRQLLTDSAVDIGDPGFDPYAGAGLVDALEAVLLAQGSEGVQVLLPEPVTLPRPRRSVLLPPAPNPANPEVTLSFLLSEASAVSLVVYDAAGRAAARVVEDILPAGNHVRVWDGTSGAGRALPSGVYWLRLTTPQGNSVQKLILAR